MVHELAARRRDPATRGSGCEIPAAHTDQDPSAKPVSERAHSLRDVHRVGREVALVLDEERLVFLQERIEIVVRNVGKSEVPRVRAHDASLGRGSDTPLTVRAAKLVPDWYPDAPTRR